MSTSPYTSLESRLAIHAIDLKDQIWMDIKNERSGENRPLIISALLKRHNEIEKDILEYNLENGIGCELCGASIDNDDPDILVCNSCRADAIDRIHDQRMY